MPHIALPDGMPGIVGLLQYRPTTAKPLNDLAEVLLRGDNTLTGVSASSSPRTCRS